MYTEEEDLWEYGNEPYYLSEVDTPMETAVTGLSPQNLDPYTYKALLAAMEHEGFIDVDAFVESDTSLLSRLDRGDYTLLPGVDTYEQLARYYYSFEYPEFVDWEQLGKVISYSLHGSFTSQGWFSWE